MEEVEHLSKKELFRKRLSTLTVPVEPTEAPLSAVNVVREKQDESTIILQSTSPLNTVHSTGYMHDVQKKNFFIPCHGPHSIIIGVGLEPPTKDYFEVLFNAINKVPEEYRSRWKQFIGKGFNFTIRSTVILYDKYGFILKGGILRKKKESSVFVYEKRRSKADYFQTVLNGDYRCSLQRVNLRTGENYIPKSKSHSQFYQSSLITLRQLPEETALCISKHPDLLYGRKNPFFIQNDTCDDIEQIRIEIVDPTEIHHMILVVHFDAPMCWFLSNQSSYSGSIKRLNLLMRLMPKLIPYVRVIDAERKVELLRYYIKDLPNLSVALQLHRVPFSELHERTRPDEKGNKIGSSTTQSYRPYSDTIQSQLKKMSTFGNQRKPPTEAWKKLIPQEAEQSPAHSEGSPSSEYDKDSSIFDSDECSTHSSEKEEILIRIDEDESTSYTWCVSLLKQEWRYIPQVALASESFLESFLHVSDPNQFGLPGIIPDLPNHWKITIHEGRSLMKAPLFCEVESNSIHHTKKHRTKVSRNHQWNETFQNTIIRGYRAGGVNISVFRKRTLYGEELIGMAHLKFGEIKRTADPDVNPSVTTWIPVLKGESQQGEVLVTVVLVFK